ncbi:MAG: uracil permease [Kiritimatiellae bacterium]|nr:uracil permease [Kiritimatiellia bacterium]
MTPKSPAPCKTDAPSAPGTLGPVRKCVVGIQFLFVAFGGTVLMPLLVGLEPSTALFTAGVGTLLFHAVTKGKVPVFLGSSFAFIAPILAVSAEWGLDAAVGGFLGVAAAYLAASALVRWRGTEFLDRVFPPVVVGPTIVLIGLSLAGGAVTMAQADWLLALVSLAVAVAVMSWGRGLPRLLPVVAGVGAGYAVAAALGRVDVSGIAAAPWFALPPNLAHPHLPRVAWQPTACLVPVALACILEHVGDIYVVGQVAGKDFVREPGLHRTLLGDGLAVLFAALAGGPPVTTYSEVTGAVQITRVTDPAVLRITAAAAIALSVFGKLAAVLRSIPDPVVGGIMLLLFGSIASVGIQGMVRNKVDFSETRNLVISGVMLTLGVGGAAVRWGSFSLGGIGLSALVGIALNMVLPRTSPSADANAVDGGRHPRWKAPPEH